MNNQSRLKVVTVVGTRPEIIRLSATIKRLDQYTDHVLVHTGQNYDYELNEVFFDDLGLRKPDHFLEADTTSLGSMLGSVLQRIETVLKSERPDAFLVLGDTNSCISALMAKRMKIPVYHMEAGNRCFDENVPEETNRRLVDHVADFNLVYTEHARRNLLAEGLHPRRILLTGSPMREVLESHRDQIESSTVLRDLELEKDGYFLVSAHREETVDNPTRLRLLLECLEDVVNHWNLPVLVSTHPRTRKRIDEAGFAPKGDVRFHRPFGFNDYNWLQVNARCVLSDSGTISEESSLLRFPAVTLRESIERPEALDAGAIVMTGLDPEGLLSAIDMQTSTHPEARVLPSGYEIADTSARVARFILSTARRHASWSGLRTAQ